MLGYWLDFDRPAYLLLLAVVPIMWFWSRRSISALGRWRRWSALALRTLVLTGIVLALAEAHLVRSNDRLAVIYLLDQSLSISPEQGKAAIEFINKSRQEQRDRRRGDLAGVIVFGKQAAVELPPLDDDLPLVRVESQVDSEFTDLASALRLARACFPSDCAKRLVILSDGNENLESAAQEARSLVDAQIGIDVVPLHRAKLGDVAVEKITIPSEARRGTPFDVRIVLNNSRAESAASGPPASGRLRVFRRAGEREELISEQDVQVRPGKQVFSFREEINLPDFYTYEAHFVPDQAADDPMPQNDRATAFTQVYGNGRVLLVEDWSRPGEFDHLIERLRQANLEVEVRPSNQAFASLAELQRFDTVVLANVPRTSGEEAADITEFSNEQIDMLVRNTQQLGGGLVMLGGPSSFGAGGWTNTALEKAMPVDFQIKNAKVVASGALMLVIDHSGSMAGGKLEMSKAAAVAALKVLGERDYIGVVAFDSEATWVVPMAHVGDGRASARRIMRLGPAGGTNMLPGMTEGYRAIAKVDTSAKHMIVLTDGHTEGSGYQALSSQMRARGITTTCVAIGADADSTLMESIARAGGGKFYRVDQPQAIPRIFMKEARRVARPLIYETEQGFQPSVAFPHEMLGGIQGPLPPLTGYVMTTVKDNPLVEVSLTAPKPGPESRALLASWTYGLGRTVALTTDAGQRWATAWTQWENYDKLLTQVVRWSMRPTSGDGKLSVFTDVADGKLRVIVTALDKNDEFLNFLAMQCTVVDPQMKLVSMAMEQAAPGRYLGECPVSSSGSYFLTIIPGQGMAPLRVGVNVPYSAEFRDLDSNDALLANLAAQIPQSGAPGQVIDVAHVPSTPESGGDVFRRDLPLAVSRQPCWHWMILAASCLFFCDVFNRRVGLSAAVFSPLAQRVRGWVRRRAVQEQSTPVMDRLRARKDEVSQHLDDRRAAARFEPAVDAVTGLPQEPAPIDVGSAAPVPPSTPAAAPNLTPQQDEDSYTSRLLKAKRKVWEN